MGGWYQRPRKYQSGRGCNLPDGTDFVSSERQNGLANCGQRSDECDTAVEPRAKENPNGHVHAPLMSVGTRMENMSEDYRNLREIVTDLASRTGKLDAKMTVLGHFERFSVNQWIEIVCP